MDIPDTVNYMVAGFVVFFTGLLAYVGSLWVRSRRLDAEEALLRDIQIDHIKE